MADDTDVDLLDSDAEQAPADESADERTTRLALEEAQRYSERAAGAQERPIFQPVDQAAPAAERPIFQPVQVPAPATAAVPSRPVFQPAPKVAATQAPETQAIQRPVFQPLGTPAQAAAAQQGWQWASTGGGAPRAELVKLPSPQIQVAWNQAREFQRQSELGTLNNMFSQAKNLPELHRALDQPIPGTFDRLTGTNIGAVSDPVRTAARDALQGQITQMAQEQYGIADPAEAFTKAMSEPNFGDYAYETGKKLYGSVMSYLDTMQKGAVDTDQLQLDDAVKKMIPTPALGAPAVSPEAAVTGTQLQSSRDALKADLLRADPNTRAQMLSAYLPYATIDPDTGSLIAPDTAALVPAIERLADPEYQAGKAANRKMVEEQAKRGLADDLRLQGRPAEIIPDALGQMLPNWVVARLMPPLLYKQIFDQERERIASENPELSDIELDNRAMARAVELTAGAEAASYLVGPGENLLIGGIKGRIARALAEPLAKAAGASATMSVAQMSANVLSQEPVLRGVREQALMGAIAGGAAGVPGAVTGLVRPRPAPRAALPEVTTGPSGARIRGPTEATLETPPPAPPTTEAPPTPPTTEAPPPAPTREAPPPVPPVAEYPGDVAKEIAEAERAYNAARGPREVGPLRGEELPAAPVTREDVARRAYEISEQRQRAGQPGDMLSDWAQAQQELSRATEPILPAARAPAAHEVAAASNDHVLENQTIADPATPEIGQQGLNDAEADALINQLNDAIEARNQARAGDIGLVPGSNHPEASVFSGGIPTATRAQHEPPQRMSIRTRTSEETGIDVAEAQPVVNELRSQLPGMPEVELVQNRADLHPLLRDHLNSVAGEDAVEAVLHGNKIYAIADENHSPQGLRKALLEEAIGHYGVEQVLGKKLDSFLDSIHQSYSGRPDYQGLIPTYGRDPHTLALEYVAKLARNEIKAPMLWDRVKSYFKNVARSVGFKPGWSDSELQVLLSRAQGHLERGGGRRSFVNTPPRFSLRPPSPAGEEGGAAGVAKVELPTREMLRGAGFPSWIRSAYDTLSRNPLTARLATALMHYVDRSRELNGQLSKPIREAFHGIKKGELKTILADFRKIMEAVDNKQPVPAGLHAKAYELFRAQQTVAKRVAELATQNRILVHDPTLNGGRGGWRDFHAVADYIPRRVSQEVLGKMRDRFRNPGAWREVVHDFINRGFANNELEVIEKLTDAAQLDHRFVDKKLGNLEKARTSRLPTSAYDYSLTSVLDHIRRVSDRMAQIEAFGQKGPGAAKDLFERTAEALAKGSIAGTRESRSLIDHIKTIRDQVLGLSGHTSSGEALQAIRSWATALDLGGIRGAFKDLVSSTTINPVLFGLKNSIGALKVLRPKTYKEQLAHAYDLGIVQHDMGMATREIEQEFANNALGKFGHLGSKAAHVAMTISGRHFQDKFNRTMTLVAAKGALRDALRSIHADPASGQSRAWIHFLARRGIDVSKLIAENGTGVETDRFLRRAVADTQAGYDLIQKSPASSTPIGKFMTMYQGWTMNQSRNVVREIVNPLLRGATGKGKEVEVRIGDRTYQVKDNAFAAAKRGLALAIAAAATGYTTNQVRQLLFGVPDPGQSLDKIAADIASDAHRMRGAAYLFNWLYNEMMASDMYGYFGNLAQAAMDPRDVRNYIKIPFFTTESPVSKVQSIASAFLHMVQEGQWNNHELDQAMKGIASQYRDVKPALARLWSLGPSQPDWAREEVTRQKINELRNSLRRFNDQQNLGLKGPAFIQDFVASPHRPAAQSIVDALYRGDALTAKKLFTDYVKAAPDAAEAKKRATALQSSITSATPLKFGAVSNKDFASAFWKWAADGNLSRAQIEEFKELVNNFNTAKFNAGFSKREELLPTETHPRARTRVQAQSLETQLLRQAMAAEHLRQIHQSYGQKVPARH